MNSFPRIIERQYTFCLHKSIQSQLVQKGGKGSKGEQLSIIKTHRVTSNWSLNWSIKNLKQINAP